MAGSDNLLQRDFLSLMESRISLKEEVCASVIRRSSYKDQMGHILEQKLAKVVYYT